MARELRCLEKFDSTSNVSFGHLPDPRSGKCPIAAIAQSASDRRQSSSRRHTNAAEYLADKACVDITAILYC
jgi:hypothetical protein